MALLMVSVFGAALISLVASPIMAHMALKRVRDMEAEVETLRERVFPLRSNVSDEPIPEDLPTAPSPPHSSSPPQTPVPTPPFVTSKPLLSGDKTEAGKQTAEEIFASRWLVWLGGITISLGAVFLVKYSIEHDLISPTLRVYLGGVHGTALVFGGEWVRRQPVQRAVASLSPDHVPAALTGAGIIALFGSVYAGYAIYGLFAPLVVFALFSIIAIGALALSILQGPFIAALGILGAFTVPMLVATGAPSVWGLFTYLTFVAACAFAVVRYKDWWWLSGFTVLASVLWQFIWFSNYWNTGDAVPLSAHMTALLALAFAVRFETIKTDNENLAHPFDFGNMTNAEILVLFTATAVNLLVFVLVRVDGYGLISLGVGAIIISVLIYIAARLNTLEALLPLAAVTATLLLATWHNPSIVDLPEKFILQGNELVTFPAPVVPPEFTSFALVAVIVAAGFGISGYLGLWRSRQPDLWAGISGAVPLAALAICYWRMGSVGVEMAWGAIAMAIAAITVAAATVVSRHRNRKGMEAALGIYALIVISAISLAATITLEKTWLTMVLTIQLPTLAWIHNKLKIGYLRPISLVIAGVVGVRLLLLHNLPGSFFHTQLDAIWILYSFGIPAATFWVAAQWFSESADDRLVTVLESGAVAIGVALISMEIRHYFGDGTLGFPRYSLLEQSLHSISWLASGYGLYRRHRKTPRPVSLWGARVLISLAAAQVMIFQLLIFNPLFTGDSVGSWLLINKLSLAYLLPAVLALLTCFEARTQNHKRLTSWAGAIAFVLLFVYLTLETRHIFQGTNLRGGLITNAEGYAYSVVWLIYAAFLLATGILWRITALRYASLGLILLVIAKVFLWDMSALSGLYRVASFLGLGLSLVGVGSLYQRFVLWSREDGMSG